MRVASVVFVVHLFAASLLSQASAPCKEITIVGPAGITMPGGSMIFKLRLDKPLPTDTKFEWSVSAGTIVSGQGTESIEVIAPPDGSARSVSTTVKLVGFKAPCDEIFSGEYGILAPIIDPILDVWGKLSRNDERARLQSAAYQLSRNPGNVLVLVISIAANESLAEAKRRELFIRNFFAHDKIVMSKNLHVPPDRLRVVFGRGESSHTSVYILPRSVFETLKCATRPEDLKPIENPQ